MRDMCIALYMQIWNDDNIRRNSYFLATSGYCPPSWIFIKTVSPAVDRYRTHAASFVRTFRLCDDVSIVCNSDVIGVSE